CHLPLRLLTDLMPPPSPPSPLPLRCLRRLCSCTPCGVARPLPLRHSAPSSPWNPCADHLEAHRCTASRKRGMTRMTALRCSADPEFSSCLWPLPCTDCTCSIALAEAWVESLRNGALPPLPGGEETSAASAALPWVVAQAAAPAACSDRWPTGRSSPRAAG